MSSRMHYKLNFFLHLSDTARPNASESARKQKVRLITWWVLNYKVRAARDFCVCWGRQLLILPALQISVLGAQSAVSMTDDISCPRQSLSTL